MWGELLPEGFHGVGGRSFLCGLACLRQPHDLDVWLGISLSSTDVVSFSLASFYVNLPIGGAAALVFLILFPKPTAPLPQATVKEILLQLDPLGTTLAVAAVVSYYLALQWGGVSKAWSDADVIGTLVGSALLAIAFGVTQWKLDNRASIIPRILAQRHVAGGSTFMFL